MIEVRSLTAVDARRHIDTLASILLDCVQGGASVSFMASLSDGEAVAFFDGVADKVDAGQCILLCAFLDAQLVGTVQVLLATPPNQPHRADVAKMLVRRSARRQGIARLLMMEVERSARAAGKTLLVLDTATGDAAEFLYASLGWTRVGVIPRYALFPDSRWCDTTIFYKALF